MTTHYKSDFLREASARGFLYQGTHLEALDAHMAAGSVIAYLGFDMTAKSLHVGSLLQIMWLRLLQKTGHKPLVLLGDGTTRIGDPSFKDSARPLLAEAEIKSNEESLSRIFDTFLIFGDGPTDARFVRNYDWLKDLNYLDFLRDYGRHFSVNRMLSFESVKGRLDREQPLSFLEFNYMIMQGYDFLELYRREGCLVQFGGQDQWGNILNGTDLIRRVLGKEAYGLTSPLIETSDGKKMGKTASGAVWLNADMRSPFEYWQFWRNTQDADVGRFLRLYTELPLSEINRLEALEGAEINEAKKILANEATRLCHGEDAVTQSLKTAQGLFEGEGVSFESLPRLDILEKDLHNKPLLIDLFVKVGLCQSKGEARRLFRGGGARLNDVVLTDEGYVISMQDFHKGQAKVSSGKKRHALVCLQRT